MVVWDRPERGARGPAPERSRAQITAAAVELADADGLAAVSMRRVARRLGTGPASLYRYVATRDDLLDLMADAVTGTIDLSDPLTGDPVEDLARLADRARRALLRHPWYLDLPTEPHLGPHGLDYLEHALRAMAPTTLPYPAQLETVGLLNALVAQFTRNELRRAGSPPGQRADHTAHLATAATEERHPHVAAALAHTPDPRPAEQPHAQLDRLIRRILTGLLS